MVRCATARQRKRRKRCVNVPNLVERLYTQCSSRYCTVHYIAYFVFLLPFYLSFFFLLHSSCNHCVQPKKLPTTFLMQVDRDVSSIAILHNFSLSLSFLFPWIVFLPRSGARTSRIVLTDYSITNQRRFFAFSYLLDGLERRLCHHRFGPSWWEGQEDSTHNGFER